MMAAPIATPKGIDQGRTNVLADQMENQAGISGDHSRIYRSETQSHARMCGMPKDERASTAAMTRDLSAPNGRLGDLATATTIAHRHRAAWHAARALLAGPQYCGARVAAYEAWRVLVAHGRAGCGKARLSRLDAWRIVVDAVHYARLKGVA